MEQQPNDNDVLIIGGGPAGLAAALWCADLGLDAVLLEARPEFGGQLLQTFGPITNYLGVTAANGRELRDRFLEHVSNKRVTLITEAVVEHADLAAKRIRLADGRDFAGRSILIATGVRRRRLGVPGEEEFRGRGVLESGIRDRAQVAGKRVVIVGGGDAALENALILRETAARVIIVHRRSEFSARQAFVDLAQNDPNIELALGSQVTSITGGDTVEGVETFDAAAGPSTIAADAIVIRIGVVPNTELFRGQIELDEQGYVIVDQNGSTSLPGIYSVGDVANPSSPTIATATGSAATTVKAVSGSIGRERAERPKI